MKKILKKVAYFITLIILIVSIYIIYQYYQLNNFNNFTRSEINLYTSQFLRDKEKTYNNKISYKIASPEFNDAMFYETIKVDKNTPYKVTCMVKTNRN